MLKPAQCLFCIGLIVWLCGSSKAKAVEFESITHSV
jgi:hypothetical protein